MNSAIENQIKQGHNELLTLILQGRTEQVLEKLADKPFDVNVLLKIENEHTKEEPSSVLKTENRQKKRFLPPFRRLKTNWRLRLSN